MHAPALSHCLRPSSVILMASVAMIEQVANQVAVSTTDDPVFIEKHRKEMSREHIVVRIYCCMHI